MLAASAAPPQPPTESPLARLKRQHRPGTGVRAVRVRRLDPRGLRRGRSPRRAPQPAARARARHRRHHVDLSRRERRLPGGARLRRGAEAQTPAADVLELALGPWGGRAISLLVMLSALGAINGMILTGTRIYAVWGADYPPSPGLASWNRRTAAPVAAIALQAVFAVMLVSARWHGGRPQFVRRGTERSSESTVCPGKHTSAASKRSWPARRPSFGACAC